MYSTTSSGGVGLVLFPIVFVLLMRWPKRDGLIIEGGRVGVFERFGAFLTDLFVAMMPIAPIIVMADLIIEYFATGSWQWSYERDFSRSTDIISAGIMVMGFIAIFYYFKWHFERSKQTLGQHFFRFKLIATRENPSMGARAFIAFVNTAWWPIWPWTILKQKQDYWWDKASGIKARPVKRF